jgi:hypothetical protein
MVRAMRLRGMLGVGAALLLHAAIAQGASVISADGACVDTWEPRDVLRGPTAIVNAPLLPVRTTIGGAEYAWNRTEWRWWHTVLLGSAETAMSAAAGMVESIWWICTGTADTLTGGYFSLAPERATQISVQPELSTVISGKPPTEPDRCGRAVVAAN